VWLNDFKSAIATEDIQRISLLIDQIPTFENLQQMEEAAYLLLHAKSLLEAEQNKNRLALQQLKNTIDFLQSSENPSTSTLNLKF